MSSWIALEDVTCRLGAHKSVNALSGINLSIEKGDFLAVVGPSGSGKSTLLYVLGGLRTPTSGTQVFMGVPDPSSRLMTYLRRNQIGFVFQAFHLLPKLTSIENISLGGRYSNATRAERTDRAAELLRVIGLEHRRFHRPGQLSGGEQQRVAIARALVNRPALLLADEPTGNLDSSTGAEILNLLQDANRQGTTVVVVSHSPAVADAAGRTVFLKDGTIASRR